MDKSANGSHITNSTVSTPSATLQPADRVRLKQFDATCWTDSQYEYVRHQYYGWRGTALEEYDWRRTHRPIGQGGFGAVYRLECVRGRSQGEIRAVKVLAKPNTAHVRSIDYGRELEAIAKFSQPRYDKYFVQSPGWYETAETICIVMEMIPCGSLHRYTGVGLPEGQVQLIVAQVLQGLDHMHRAGYTHRDLKPEVGSQVSFLRILLLIDSTEFTCGASRASMACEYEPRSGMHIV